TYNSYHGSVDTPIDGVDTGYHSLKQFHKDRVQCVNTVPGSVDTRRSLQKTQLPDWDSVSTQTVAVPSLHVLLNSSIFCQARSTQPPSGSTQSLARSTHIPSCVDTKALPGKSICAVSFKG
ncbi:hypothetical protein Taro_015550, partial [Colocasia esculenta]|nr:hypothetical protein [Colocasia esculenta]